MPIICAKCKRHSIHARSIALRPKDFVHKMVCIPCHERLTIYRLKRKEKLEREANEPRSNNAAETRD